MNNYTENKLKISIVTVCRNAHETLYRTYESVQRQDYLNREYIVIDGASTDGTVEIIKKIKNDLDQYISEPDAGLYDAMNKGLALCTGDIVAFLNADDFYINSNVLSQVADTMISKNLDVLTGNVSMFDSNNEEMVIRTYNSGKFKPEYLAWGLMPAHPALFVRRDVLLNSGGFKKDYKIAADFELVARMFTQQNLKLGHVDKVLVKMQRGGISNANLLARHKINLEILRACRENKIKTNIFKIWMRYPGKISEYHWIEFLFSRFFK